MAVLKVNLKEYKEMDVLENFIRDMQAGPVWVSVWVSFMGVVLLLAVPFAIKRAEARWTIIAMFCVFPLMMWFYSRFGYQRVLGMAHVIFWTPLVIYFWLRRCEWRVKETLGGKWILVVFITMCTSLVIDYVDVIRYFMGHRI